jgi:hypothetical protein
MAHRVAPGCGGKAAHVADKASRSATYPSLAEVSSFRQAGVLLAARPVRLPLDLIGLKNLTASLTRLKSQPANSKSQPANFKSQPANHPKSTCKFKKSTCKFRFATCKFSKHGAARCQRCLEAQVFNTPFIVDILPVLHSVVE